MIHRDVKQESICLFNGPGAEKVKLLNFGISKLKEALLGDRFRTFPEAVIGMFQYLSPEQVLGKLSNEIDAHADLATPAVLTDLVMHCLNKDPDSRPGSARDFIREVEHVEKEIGRIEKARQARPQTPGHHKSPGWKFWKR